MVGLPVDIKVIEDFDEALAHFKKKFNKMKTSLDPFGVLFLA
jgi:hypothetical protein